MDRLDITIISLWRKIKKIDKCAFLAGFILNLVCHFYIYTNALFHLDGITIFEEGTFVRSGRLFCALLSPAISNGYALPWLNGLVGSVFIGFAVVFLCKILRVRSGVWATVIAGLIAGNYAYACCQIYVSTSFVYSFAILAATFSAYCALRGGVKWSALSAVFFMISLCCYQAYVCFSISLFIFIILFSALRDNISFSKALRKGLHLIGISVVSMILYYCLWKLCVCLSGCDMISYRGYDDTISNISGGLWSNLLFSYFYGIRWIFKSGVSASVMGTTIHIAMGIIAPVGFASMVYKNNLRKKGTMFIAVFALLLLPLSSGIIYALNPGTMPFRMQFCSVIMELLFVVVISSIRPSGKHKRVKKATVWLALVMSVVYVYCSFVSANVAYLKLESSHNNALSVTTRIVERIETVEGYSKDTLVIFVCEEEQNYSSSDWGDELPFAIGGSAVSANLLPIYLKQEMNSLVKSVYDWSGSAEALDSVKALECFPSLNCYTWEGDKLIFKLPNLSE